MTENTENTHTKPGVLDRLLGMFSNVQPGEGGHVLLMLISLLLLMMAYYILKTVREPLILVTGGAEVKSYATGAQAIVLMGFIPLYSWIAARVNRRKLIIYVAFFFIITLEILYLGGLSNVKNLGFIFYVWVGIFSLSMIAQFWSLANDMYSEETGKRLFPVIMIGAAAGSPLGALIAKKLFDASISPFSMMQIAAVVLLVHLALLLLSEKKESKSVERETKKDESLAGSDGFVLVFRNRFILLIALVLIVLNLVNTTGEYILGKSVKVAAVDAISLDPGIDENSFIGSFYGGFFFYVNILTFLIQAFLVSRIVKYLGMRGVLFALPIVAFGAYGLIAFGVGFAMMRAVKMAENSTDYSVMNTAKALLWLPTSREEKYKAKQAVDTFFYRFGDLLSAGFVFIGTTMLHLGVKGFAVFNCGLIVIWIVLLVFLYKQYNRLSTKSN